MAKSFYTTGTGDEQTLTPIINEKVPIYDTITDAESDLANLKVGQIVKTKDTGLVANLNPIDEVKQGVFLPPTSNAVADSLSYSTTEQKTGGKWIDGKDIYKITLVNNSYSLVANQWNVLSAIFSNYTSLNVDNIVSYKLYYFSASQDKRCEVKAQGISNEKLYLTDTVSPKSNSRVELTIEYTKTTD